MKTQHNTTATIVAPRELPVSANDIAPHLGITARTVINQAAAGNLPHIRVGKSYRFILSEVLNHVRR